MSRIGEALAAHGSISAQLRASAAPIVRVVPPKRILHTLGFDNFRAQDRFEIDIGRRAQSGWTSMGNLVQSLLDLSAERTKFATNDFGTSRALPVVISHHDVLRSAIEYGSVQALSSVTVTLDEALGRAESEAGSLPARLGDKWQRTTLINALNSAQDYHLRRLMPSVLSINPEFFVPDAIDPKDIVYLIDQVWITREQKDSDHVRVLGVYFDRESDQPDDRRDGVLAAMGYEVFHLAGWWARIEPQRVIREFLRAAGLPLVDTRTFRVPGATINDYRCAFCRRPVVRSESGYGIAWHREQPLHEECFNEAVNCGAFDHLEPTDERLSTVENFS